MNVNLASQVCLDLLILGYAFGVILVIGLILCLEKLIRRRFKK